MQEQTSTSANLISVEIERYDVATGQSGAQTYQVPLGYGWTVLNVLNWIYENVDPTIGYYYSCRIGKCEACDCLLNGQKILTCNSIANGDMVLAPMPEFQVYKDLIPNRLKARVSVAGPRRLTVRV